MPAGKIAKIKTVESWPVTPLHGQPGRRPLGRHHARPRIVRRTRRRHRPCRRARRATRGGFARGFSGCTTSRWPKARPILVRLGTRETRATVVAIEKAVDPGELSSVETKAIARNHVGEIDISLAQPIAADPYTDNPRTGRLVIEVNGRIAGGGLVLSVDAGQRAVPVDIVPVESALRPDERSARYRHNGAVIWLTGLPGSGKSTLARALERRLFARGGSPILLDGDTLRAGLNGDLGFSAAGPQRKHPPARRGRDPSGAQRPHRHRRRGLARGAMTAPRRAASPTPVPRDLCRHPGRSLREPRSQGPLRQGARRHAARLHRHRQRLPAAGRLRTEHRHLDALGPRRHRRDRADAGAKPAFCSTNWSISPPISEASRPLWGLLIDPALWLKGPPTLPFGAFFAAVHPENSL